MTTQKKKLTFFFLLFSLFFFIYFFKAESSFIVNTDFTRDLFHILKISRGDLTLIGPYLSFGYYTGPFYYYLFAPLFALTHSSITSVFLLNSLIFSLSLSVLFLLFSSRFKTLPSFISTIILGLSPFFISTARHPGNGFSYLPFLLIFLSFTHLRPPQKTIPTFLLGLLVGIIINFHPASLLVIIPSSLYLFLQLKNKKNFLSYFFGVSLSFLPLLLFEIKNSFIITQGFFHHPNRHSTTNLNPLPRLKFLFSSLFPLHLLLPTLSLLLHLPSFDKTKSHLKLFLLPLSSLLLYLLLPIPKLETHYLLPIFLTLSFFSLLSLLQLKTLSQLPKNLILSLLLLLPLLSFPLSTYQPSSSTLNHYRQAVNYTINQNLIPTNQSFNLISINGPQHLIPVGHGYRFFFLLKNHPSLETSQYCQADHLLIFSTDSNFSPTNLNCWETNQFGQEKIQNFNLHQLPNLNLFHITPLKP